MIQDYYLVLKSIKLASFSYNWYQDDQWLLSTNNTYTYLFSSYDVYRIEWFLNK